MKQIVHIKLLFAAAFALAMAQTSWAGLTVNSVETRDSDWSQSDWVDIANGDNKTGILTNNYAGTVTIGGNLSVGRSGNGAYGEYVQNAGTVNVGGKFVIGYESSLTANAIIAGGTMTVTDEIRFPRESSCTPSLVVRGGSLTGNSFFHFRKGTMTVDSGTVNINNDFYMGEHGAATLTINGGSVTVAPGKWIAFYDNQGANTITLNGGTLTIPVLGTMGGAGTIVFNGGTLAANNSKEKLLYESVSPVKVKARGGTINAGGYTIDVNASISEDTSSPGGGMTFCGGGTVTLSGAISYTGGTTIEAGTTLLVDTAAKKDVILGSGQNTLKVIPAVGTHTLVTITGEDTFTDGDELKASVADGFATDAVFALSGDKKSLTVTVGSVYTLVFPGATLADLATHTLRARMGGSSFDADGVEVTFFNRVETVENDVLTKVTYQLQAIDDNFSDNQWTKAAKVEFTADASGVYAKLADGNYSNYGYQNQFGTDPLESNPGKSNYIPYDFQLVEPATAISVNFTQGGKNLDNSSSVRYGAGDYAVPYSSWNNMAAANNGTATYGGATITITKTSGGWYCENLSNTKDLRRGYLDDGGGSVIIEVTNIPYEFYRIVTYHATDNANVTFGYVKINDTRYTGITDATVKGNSAWGATASSHYALGFREGVNYLVSDVMSGTSATITGHRESPARGCIAAIQIVEYVPPTYTATISDGGAKTFSTLNWDKTLPASLVSSDQVVINVNEDTTLTLDSAIDVYAIKFNVAEGKTLTLAGSNVAAQFITATGAGQTVVANASQLSGTVKGDGTLVYGAAPSGLTLTGSTWSGVLWLKNCAIAGVVPANMASANSTLRLSGVTGYFNNGGNTSVCAGTLDLVNDAYAFALSVSNGWSDYGITVFEKLTGDGTLGVQERDIAQRYVFKDVSGFTGTINLASRPLRVILGNGESLNPANGTITVASGATATIAAGKTWTANYSGGGMIVNGTLMLGAGATAPAVVSGTGTVDVASGTGTLNGYGAGAALTLSTALEATLVISDGTLTSMSIGGLDNQGTIDLAGTALTEATLKLSPGVTAANVGTVLYPATFERLVVSPTDQAVRSLGGFTAPTLPEGATYYVLLAETREEFGKGSMTVTDVASGVNVRVLRPNGTYVDVVSEDGTVTLTEDVHIDGIATMYDATFTNTTKFAYQKSSDAWIGCDSASDPRYNNTVNDETTGIYLRHHPYVENARADIYGLGDFTVVVVGQMSPTHKCQFIHIGSTVDSNTGLLIATTDVSDEVIIAPNAGKTVDTVNAVKVSVPNAASARHAYVINKKERTFTVWVDGVRRGTFTVADGWTVGSSDHAGVQVGSDFGGKIKSDSSEDKFSAVADSLDETGVINLMRIYDYVISERQAEAIFNTYPYVSQGGLYKRTITADGTFSETDAWTKDGAEGAFDVPVGVTIDEVNYNPSATLTVNAAAEIGVNADVAIETLTVGGMAPVKFTAAGAHTLTVVGAAIINSPVTNEYGAVYLAGAPVQLGSSGSICFDCSGFDMSGIYMTNRYQLTGLIERDDAKVTIIPPTGVMSRTAEISYNTTGSCYDFVVMPDHEAGSDIYYKSGTLADGSADLVVVLADGTTQTMIFPGDNIVFDDAVVGENAVVQFGETLPANVTFSFGNWTGMVVPTQPSSMYVWTGEAEDGKASTAGNWYGGAVPPVGAAVYIPSKTATIVNDIDGFAPASITFGYGNGVVTIEGNAIAGIQEITNLSSSTHVLNVPVSFAQDVVLNYSDFPVDFAGGATGRTLVLAGLENGGWHLKGTYNLETWQGAYCFIDADATVNAETASGLGNVRIEEGGRLVVGDYTLNVTDPSAAVKWVLYYNKGHFIVTNALTNTSSERTSMFSNNSGEADTAFYGMNIIERLVNTPTADVEFLLGKYGDVDTGFNEWVRGTYQFGAVTWGERASPIVGWRTCSPKIYFAETSTLAAVADGQYIGCLEDEKYYACDIDGNPSEVTLDCDLSYVAYGGACLYDVIFGGGGKFTLATGRTINRNDKKVTVSENTTLALVPGSNVNAASLSVKSGSSIEVATSGTVSFGGNMTLAADAILGFNFTQRNVAPVLSVAGSVTADGTIKVKVEGRQPAFLNGGKHVLTSGGKFFGKTVSLAEGTPSWVTRVSVNENNDIVADIKPMETRIFLR